MKDDSDPLNGWNIDEIMQHAPPAKKDMYGAMYFYLQKLLLRCCSKVRSSNIDLQLFQVNALELPNLLKGCGQASSFDGIEVSFTFIPLFPFRP
jgi:hypothetical protein